MGRGSEDGAALERRLLKEVGRLLKELGFVQSRQPLIVAVSGGPDSLALLLLLAQLRQPLALSLHVAHLDHGLRGQESQRDAKFVEEVAHSLDLPVTLEREEVSSYRTAHHLSLEEAAREVRYSFLSRVAIAQEAAAVALGHTADDQVETILLHLLRGSGLAGLAGMSPLAYWPSSRHDHPVALVRPLLEVGREETESYCRWKGVTPRDDPSNRSLLFTRNRVRFDLLPRLRAYNPRLREAMVRLGRSAAQDQAYILGEATQARERLAVNTGEGVRVERKGFAALPPALKRHLLRLIYQELRGSTLGLEHRHLEEMVKLSQGETGRRVSLPGGLAFSVDYDFLRLGPGRARAPVSPALSGEYPLDIPGNTRLPGWSVQAHLSEDMGCSSSLDVQDAHAARLDGERVGRHLYVRGRRAGDRFHPLGMETPKKLQDFLVDAKVPRDRRDTLPLVLSEKGIVWVVGHRIAHWARLREDTTVALGLEFSPETAT
ncbi:MAG: tRNA(Ile)-lysidine synthetase [Dehalococcoidia bacterium]|nr:tRNA(Ile)-lysidine synthetase [Dehalococcoidia bacterium]